MADKEKGEKRGVKRADSNAKKLSQSSWREKGGRGARSRREETVSSLQRQVEKGGEECSAKKGSYLRVSVQKGRRPPYLGKKKIGGFSTHWRKKKERHRNHVPGLHRKKRCFAARESSAYSSKRTAAANTD